MPGKRGHKSELGDLLEARASVDRAIDLAHERKCITDAELIKDAARLTAEVKKLRATSAPISHAVMFSHHALWRLSKRCRCQ